MISGPVVPMVSEGLDVIKLSRKMLGKSEPELAAPGTIRGDFSIDKERSIIHGSHSIKSAEYEINLWFKRSELVQWKPANFKFFYLP